MKERENRESWIRANDYPSHNAINRYLYIVITGFLRVRQNLEPPGPNGARAVFALLRTHWTGYFN